jgi:hypothetical protein
LLHLREVTPADVVKNIRHKLGLVPEPPYTGRYEKHEIPWFSWPRQWFLPRRFPRAAQEPEVAIVTTVLASAEVITRWLWTNHQTTGVGTFILFVENPEVVPAVRAFADAHLPAVCLTLHPASADWYAAREHRYCEQTRAYPTARQIENLQWTKAQSPPGTWLVTMDIDEVIWLSPAVRKRHAQAQSVLAGYLAHEADRISEVRFRIAEFVPPASGLRRGVFPPQVAARVKHEIGCEGRRMSRFHHWRYLIHMFSDAEPLPFLTKLYGFLAGESGDLLEGRHLRGHTSSKSAFRAEMYAEVNMHGGLQWFADGDQKELYPVRLSREIWLIHFDIFNPNQLASKTAHIQEVLSRGDTRSPGRAATLRGLDALVNSGSMTLDEFFRRYISMKPRAWRVARLLCKVRTFDLSEAFHSMPPVPENEDVKYGENQGNAYGGNG